MWVKVSCFRLSTFLTLKETFSELALNGEPKTGGKPYCRGTYNTHHIQPKYETHFKTPTLAEKVTILLVCKLYLGVSNIIINVLRHGDNVIGLIRKFTGQSNETDIPQRLTVQLTT